MIRNKRNISTYRYILKEIIYNPIWTNPAFHSDIDHRAEEVSGEVLIERSKEEDRARELSWYRFAHKELNKNKARKNSKKLTWDRLLISKSIGITSLLSSNNIISTTKSSILKSEPLISESSLYLINQRNIEDKFNEWLSGVFDSKGTIKKMKLSKYKREEDVVEIIVEFRRKEILTIIQNRLGGTITECNNRRQFRYRLWGKKSIYDILNRMNGIWLWNRKRHTKARLYRRYGIIEKKLSLLRVHLNNNSNWYGGVLDAGGYIVIGYDEYDLKDIYLNVITMNNDRSNLFQFKKIFKGKLLSNKLDRTRRWNVWYSDNQRTVPLRIYEYNKMNFMLYSRTYIRYELIKEFFDIKKTTPFDIDWIYDYINYKPKINRFKIDIDLWNDESFEHLFKEYLNKLSNNPSDQLSLDPNWIVWINFLKKFYNIS